MVKKDGTVAMTGNLNMGTKLITNLGTPVATTDATTKGYVDTADVLMVKKDGTVAMTGNLNMATKLITNLRNSSDYN
jgi:hypothetical protein